MFFHEIVFFLSFAKLCYIIFRDLYKCFWRVFLLIIFSYLFDIFLIN